MDVGKGQRDPREGFDDVPHFRRWRLHELATDRRIEKQMPHFDRRADIHRARFNRFAIGSLGAQLIAAVA